ncbi:MAG: 5'/3'-nucleotidase SurE, partial [Parahaliea sp.]
MRYKIACAALAAGLVSSAQALDIVIANDDSYETYNVQQLKIALENAGHQVLVSVPCAHQSGKGGSLGSFLQSMPVHSLVADGAGRLSIDDSAANPDGYCVGDTEAEKESKSFRDYRDGTPTVAAAHGLFKANELWGKKPDLLVSGPNEGQNVGYAVFISGTLGAAHYALVNGVPAIAISAGGTPSDEADALDNAQLVAQIAVDVVEQLEAKRRRNGPLLPPLTGLNINTPTYDMLEGAPYMLTDVNWYFGSLVGWMNLGAPGST